MSPPFLLVASDFIRTGGMDRANYALADYLARAGVEVHLVANSAGSGLRQRPTVHWHPVAKPLGIDALGWGKLDRAGRRLARRLGPRGVRVLVNGGNCAWDDLNWVHYVHAAYRAPSAGGPLTRAFQAWKNGRARRDERRALPLARVVVANSEQTRQALLTGLRLAPERVHTVYYGCDGGLFAPASGEQRRALRLRLGWPAEGAMALFVGALGDRRKGFDTLFGAWRRLRAAGGWRPQLAVLGSGREQALWVQRVAAAGLNGSIRFLGFRRDVPDVMRAADLLIAPTRYEAFGLAVQEAVACGLPAIVSAAAGVAERLRADMSDLLLADPESETELASRLRAWQEGAAFFAAAAGRAGRRLRAWSWDDMARQIVGLAGATPAPAAGRTS